MEAYEKIAKILRTDKDFVLQAAQQLEKKTGKTGVLEAIVEENQRLITEHFSKLGVASGSAEEIFTALAEKIKRDDAALSEHLNRPTCDSEEGCSSLITTATQLANTPNGFFLKQDLARQFLEKEPPPRTLQFFGLSSVDELLKKFDLFEVYCALRFVEDKEWLNNTFFKQLDGVTPDDFEERPIKTHILHPEWLKAAESFVKKKYHNVSHLKELGVVFVIPVGIAGPGDTTRLFSLLLHYLHEVSFYSDLFRKFAGESKDTYAAHLISALRGDVLDAHFSDEDRGRTWMIVQRYLAKEDENDWRLYEPHINPEAIHWSKAEDDIARLGAQVPSLGVDFWNQLDWVGDYYKDASGVNVLVSLNLIDVDMSLVEQHDRTKFTYHQQEAMWNKIFSEYIGREHMEKLIIEQFEKGYLALS